MMHASGEVAGSKAAGKFGIPFTLSTLGTSTVEQVAEANPDGRN
jgi:isopentenyl diphosphate isomerase/L-lactate dehydrogenase-like FMN-dependent dehydrogenase